jgi:hypothetical protein
LNLACAAAGSTHAKFKLVSGLLSYANRGGAWCLQKSVMRLLTRRRLPHDGNTDLVVTANLRSALISMTSLRDLTPSVDLVLLLPVRSTPQKLHKCY